MRVDGRVKLLLIIVAESFKKSNERLRSRQSNSDESGYSKSGNSGYVPEQNYSDGGGGISDNISAEGAAGLTIILGVLIAIGWAFLVTFVAFLTGPALLLSEHIKV